MIGIAGVGMSALAQLLHKEGVEVTGSDSEEGFPTLNVLRELGILYSIGYSEDNVPKDADAVIYTDAVPKENVERMQASELGVPQVSYFAALGEVSRGKYTVAVAGTHGKTTTTGMLAKILHDAEASPTAIVGSIVRDFESNYLSGESDLFVVEACEYKDHFLSLTPSILVITNIEFDHSDYFTDLASVQDSFAKSIDSLPEGGVLITNPGDINIKPLLESVQVEVIDYTKETLPGVELSGFNRENAQAATAAARAALSHTNGTLTDEVLKNSLTTYRGSWRRFEEKGTTKAGARVFDDYAHHPTAVQKTIEMARSRFPGEEIVVLFHPHLYSRTKSLFREFAEALSLSDQVYILPIYSARERAEEYPGVDSKALARAVNDIAGNATHLETFEGAEKALAEFGPKTILITMGAGDVFHVADRLTA